MELADRNTGRVAELTGEAGLLRKQLANAEHELERLVIAGQVITQLVTGDAAAGEPGAAAAETGRPLTCAMAAASSRPSARTPPRRWLTGLVQQPRCRS